MLRGIRWQLFVLVMAAGLFAIALVNSRDEPAPVVPTSLPPTATTVASLPTAAPATRAAPGQPTPRPVVNIQTGDDVVTYREALVGSIQRLNPLLADLNPVDHDITSLIFEGLTRTDVHGEPTPDLAANWVISSDGLEYIIKLRQDVLWQDGVPFNADDVMYTMSLLQSPDFPGPADLGQFWRTVEVEKLDTYLVRFRLTQPLGSFLDALRIGILPEHALRGTTAAHLAGHPFNGTPIGTGPYQLEALRSEDGSRVQIVDLRVAPVYRQRPEGKNGYRLERVRFQLFDSFDAALAALRDGEVDGLAASNRTERGALMGVPNVNIDTALESSVGMVIFNWAKEGTRYFREIRLRQALQMGLDRNSIIQRLMSTLAVPANSPLVPGSWAYSADLPWPKPDVSGARALMQNAKLPTPSADAAPEGAGGPLSFHILTPNDPTLVNVVNEIAAQWSQLNISVSADPVDTATYLKRLDDGDFDAALVELSLGSSADPDVYHFWDQGQYPDGYNYGGMDDRRISEELERARRDPSGINRAIRYQNFQREFVERAIALPLYYPLYTYAVASDVTGVQLGFIGSPASRFATIQDWTIDTTTKS
jgi:peptide/nickel transport system substrate-binding protein